MGNILKILVILILCSLNGFAQDPCLPGEDCAATDAPSTPLDGGVSLLIGAAALYGAKKLRDKKKQDEQL